MENSPTVHPAHPFNATEDAKALKIAFKGLGTDEDAIIGIITKRSNAQRNEIAVKFKTMYGKDLIKEMHSELSGNLEDLIVGLMMPPEQYYAKQLHKAISGMGTNEKALVEILALQTNKEMRAVRQAYEQMYKGTSLENDIKGDTSGSVQHLLVALTTANRNESHEVDPHKAHVDAQTLLRAGELFTGTDEPVFIAVLCQRSRPQANAIFDEYFKITGHEFEKAVENEFGGTAKDVLLAVAKIIRNPIEYLADRLYESMAGMGTDDNTLIRIIVSRSEKDLGAIKTVFQQKYEKSLADFISGDTSGHYRKCLLSIVD